MPKSLSRILPISSFFLVLALGLTFALWKAQYGFDLYDDAYSLAHGFKLYHLGDLPILDESQNGFRQHDLLNHLVVRPLLPYNVLSIRYASIWLHALLLLGLCWISFQRFQFAGGLTATLFLVFAFLAAPQWSYNHWARNGLLAHHFFFLLGSTIGGWVVLGPFFAGMAFATACLAYAPFAIVIPLTLTAIYFSFRGVNRHFLPAYSLGLAVILIPYLWFVTDPGIQPHWAYSYSLMRSLKPYQNVSSWLKGGLILAYLATRVELWIVGALVLFWAKFGKFQKHAVVGASIFIVGRLVYKNAHTSQHLGFWVLGAAVSLAAIGVVTLFKDAHQEKNYYWYPLILVSVACAAIMGMASEGANGALYWSAGSMAIPLLGFLFRENTYREIRPVLLTLLICLVGGALLYESRQTFADVPVADCTTKIQAAPLDGLYTSERKAFLLEKLSYTLAKSRYALTIAGTPAFFLFGQVRSSLDSIFPFHAAPEFVHVNSLKRMLNEARIPDYIIRMKTNGRTWGGGQTLITYPETPEHPLVRFAACAQNGVVIDEPELVVWSVARERVAGCVEGVTRNPVVGELPREPAFN